MLTKMGNPYESPGAFGRGGLSMVAIRPSLATTVVFIGGLAAIFSLTMEPFLKTYAELGLRLPYVTIIAMSPGPSVTIGLLLLATLTKEVLVPFQ